MAALPCHAEVVEVLIKGVDDGVKSTKQQDYMEAVMNAKLQAIERAGVEISSITRIENFKVKYDTVESKAEAVLLPGFQVMDLGYQQDSTYQVVLSGKVESGGKIEAEANAREAVKKVEDKLLELMPESSFEATERIRVALELLPADFDWMSHNLIRQARTRLLAADLKEKLGAVPQRPSRPLRLVTGDSQVEEDYVEEDSFHAYRYKIPGSYILFEDGSKDYGLNYGMLAWVTGNEYVLDRRPRTEEDRRRLAVGGGEESFEDAQKKFPDKMNQFEKDVELFNKRIEDSGLVPKLLELKKLDKETRYSTLIRPVEDLGLLK
jgi:hypothetical protein